MGIYEQALIEIYEMKRQRLASLSSALLAIGIGTCLLTGCGSNKRQVVTVTRKLYEKNSYQTVNVQRGNLKPSISLELNPEDYEEISYSIMKEDLKLEEVHVSVGNRVKKGDLLVSFESEELRQKILEYEDEKKQKELLVEHYEKLMKIDKTMDYKEDIKMLREDIQVAQLYIEETEEKLLQYQIIATKDGVITKISDFLQNGVIRQGITLLTETCGNGRYQTVTAEDDIFEVGEVYTATGKAAEYELRLIDQTEENLIFEPASGMPMFTGGEVLTLTMERPEKKNVVYVDKNAVYTIEGRGENEDTYCVYVMEESGYQRGIFVTPGECVGDNMIITEGLNGGEKVVIR